MSHETVGNLLAPFNALLNLTSVVFLLSGFLFVRRRNIRGHRAAMTGALVASALFLFFYLIRVSLTGTHRFAGEGVAKTAYLGLLFSHMFLAIVILPMVGRLIYLVRHRRFRAHARLARWTFPIWLYVSVTGLVVYILLYHAYGYL